MEGSFAAACRARLHVLSLAYIAVLLSLLADSSAQLAVQQLIVVPAGGSTVIRLSGYDKTTANTKLRYAVQAPPSSGNLYQLSQVFSDYGYDPKAGRLITSPSTIVTGSNSRVYYVRPTPDAASNQLWDTFAFTTNNGATESYAGTVTLVPPSGALVGSDFLLDNAAWTVSGNKATVAPATFEPYSRGALLNHYIYGTDDKINAKGTGGSDAYLWYFEAPSMYMGNWGIAYGGFVKFTIGIFSGDMQNMNAPNTHLVELECAACDGPVGKGITLAFPLSALTATIATTSASGDATVYMLPLLETAGWLKDPQNSLKPWTAPSRCDLILVLSRLSDFRILGDWTRWYESVGLDDVQILNTVGQLPRCANSMPDASTCKCSCGESVC